MDNVTHRDAHASSAPDNLITNPLDKPGAHDNLIENPLDKE